MTKEEIRKIIINLMENNADNFDDLYSDDYLEENLYACGVHDGLLDLAHALNIYDFDKPFDEYCSDRWPMETTINLLVNWFEAEMLLFILYKYCQINCIVFLWED